MKIALSVIHWAFVLVMPILLVGIVAIVLGRSARRDGTTRPGLATAGIWLGGIAVILQLLVVLGLVGLLTVRTSGGTETSGQAVVVQDAP